VGTGSHYGARGLDAPVRDFSALWRASGQSALRARALRGLREDAAGRRSNLRAALVTKPHARAIPAFRRRSICAGHAQCA